MTDTEEIEQIVCSENINTVVKYEHPCVPKKYIRMNPMRLEWGGLVTFPTPQNTNRYTWHISYLQQLIDMYKIAEKVISSRYPNSEIKWKTKKHFNDFSILIYGCSSKYISPYLEDPPELDYDLNTCESDEDDNEIVEDEDENGEWETV
jgi:hypothetical protein